MKELSPKNVAIIALLVVAVGLGGVFLGRSLVDQAGSDAEEAASAETATTEAPTSTTAAPGDPAASADGGGATEGGGDGVGSGAVPAVEPPPAPGELRPVESASGARYAYQNSEDARGSTGTVPPPVLPVRVSMSSLSGLRDGDPVNIRVEAVDSQIFGFDARICRADAVIVNDFDYNPLTNPQCSDYAFSSGSDGPIRVAADAAAQVAEGSIRVGMGTVEFETVDGGTARVTCDRANPCKLVLKLQVPYGFGFQEFPFSWA